MIRNFENKETECLANAAGSCRPKSKIRRYVCSARWHECAIGTISAIRRATSSMRWVATGQGNMLYGLTGNGTLPSGRLMECSRMSKSPIIIDASVGDPADWLHNPHAGEMLDLEFMVPLALSSEEAVADVVSGKRRMNAELDLRLTRYFRMSPGFFLGLQIDYELLEAKRALNGELDRIVPRAA